MSFRDGVELALRLELELVLSEETDEPDEEETDEAEDEDEEIIDEADDRDKAVVLAVAASKELVLDSDRDKESEEAIFSGLEW